LCGRQDDCRLPEIQLTELCCRECIELRSGEMRHLIRCKRRKLRIVERLQLLGTQCLQLSSRQRRHLIVVESIELGCAENLDLVDSEIRNLRAERGNRFRCNLAQRLRRQGLKLFSAELLQVVAKSLDL